MNQEQFNAITMRVISQYKMDINGIHGMSHWKRVKRLGGYLADAEAADTTVIKLFSLFHDACRRNEFGDPMHGTRAGSLVASLYGARALGITRKQKDALVTACDIHTTARPSDNIKDITVQCCIDADRLDLCRLGIIVDPGLLFTTTAKLQTMRDQAVQIFEQSQNLRTV